MRTLLRAALAAAFLYGSLALVAWWADGTARAGETVVVKQPVADDGPTPQLMRALMAWASPRLGLPVPAVVPRIVRKGHCELQVIAFQDDAAKCAADGTGVLALYASNVMWLNDGWRGDSLRDVSILLHELVHHMQHHAGVEPVPCRAEALEKPAYDAQFAFLEAAGVDPKAMIRINALMLFLVTQCHGQR